MDDMPTLRQLLDEGERWDAEYGGGLSSHLPMALVALARLGASPERLRAYASAYAEAHHLEPARPIEAWPAGRAWQSRFGERAAWPAYRGLFRQWLAGEGSKETLALALPALLPGCGAAAFHGIIRTAYGVQAAHAGELADGLAHWAASFLPLGDLAAAPATEPDPAELVRRLPAATSKTGLIADRMAAAARGGEVARIAAALRLDEGTPQRLARAAAAAYAETGSFTALHLVTGTHAMRVLAPFVADADAAWRWFWHAFAHGVVAAGLRPAAPAPLEPWETILPFALSSDDEHVVKLVDSAREEERTYGGDDWRRAASRVVASR